MGHPEEGTMGLHVQRGPRMTSACLTFYGREAPCKRPRVPKPCYGIHAAVEGLTESVKNLPESHRTQRGRGC